MIKGNNNKNKKPIVCDIGASSIKIGFAGKLKPLQVIPNVIAVSRFAYLQSEMLLAKEALAAQNRKKYKYIQPIDEYGVVQHWEGLEALLRYSLRAIGVDPTKCHEHKILLTKAHSMKRSDAQTLLELIYHKFHFGAVTMHEQAALVLYTQGVETGVVVELGDTMATIIPVYKGYAIPKLNKSMGVGGRSISQYLLKLLHQHQGLPMDSREDLETGREIKERGSYIALDPIAEERLAEQTTSLEKTIHIHDGNTIAIGKERFAATEILFQPKLWDSEQSGLADILFETIQEAPIDCRLELYQNIILSGGSSLIPGLQERLEHDLAKRYHEEVVLPSKNAMQRQWKLQVHAPETRRYAVFEGAALFADLIANEQGFWVTKLQYESEGGMTCIMDKCRVA